MNMTCMFRSGGNLMFQSNYMTQYVTVISSKHRQSRFWITVVHAICPCLLSEIQSGKFVLFPSTYINFYTQNQGMVQGVFFRNKNLLSSTIYMFLICF